VLGARLGCAEAPGDSARGVAECLWRCVLDFGICRSWPLGPPEFIARAAALGKFGMRVGLCCAGCLSLDVCARSYINWMYGGRGNGRGWIVASHRI
jgi:hypothetical protein